MVIFRDLDDGKFLPIKNIPNTIAAVANEHPPDEYAGWVDEYLGLPVSAKIVEWIEKPLPQDFWDRDWSHHATRGSAFLNIDDSRVHVQITTRRRCQNWTICEDSDDLVFVSSRIINSDGSARYCNHLVELFVGLIAEQVDEMPGEEQLSPLNNNLTDFHHMRRPNIILHSVPRSSFYELHAKFSNGLEKEEMEI